MRMKSFHVLSNFIFPCNIYPSLLSKISDHLKSCESRVVLQLHTKNIMHGGLTPSKFICNCNGVFKRKSSFGSKSAKLLRMKQCVFKGSEFTYLCNKFLLFVAPLHLYRLWLETLWQVPSLTFVWDPDLLHGIVWMYTVQTFSSLTTY